MLRLLNTFEDLIKIHSGLQTNDLDRKKRPGSKKGYRFYFIKFLEASWCHGLGVNAHVLGTLSCGVHVGDGFELHKISLSTLLSNERGNVWSSEVCSQLFFF